MTRTDRFAYWLTWTFRGQVMLWVLERVAFLLGALLTGWGVYTAERLFLPVITGWTVDRIELNAGHLVLAGKMHKTRPCELIATSVMAVPKKPLEPRVLIYQVKPDEILGGNAPVGIVSWGPWRVAVPEKLIEHKQDISFLEIVGHHRCHAAWQQETLYGRVDIKRLPL
jgi:hypothetical protein